MALSGTQRRGSRACVPTKKRSRRGGRERLSAAELLARAGDDRLHHRAGCVGLPEDADGSRSCLGEFVSKVICDLGWALSDFVSGTPDLFGHHAQSVRESLDVVTLVSMVLSFVVNASLKSIFRHGAPSLVS
jgi:hypothetical protein